MIGAPPTAALRSLINSKLKLACPYLKQEVINVNDAGNSARNSLLLFRCVKSKYNPIKQLLLCHP